MAGLRVEDPEVGVGGPSGGRKPLLAELGEDEEEAGALLRPDLGLGQRLQRRREVAEALELPVEPLQRHERARGEGRVEPARLLVEVRRIGRALQRTLEERAEPQRDRATGLAQPRKAFGEQRGERLVPSAGGVGLFQDRPGPLRVVGHGTLDPRQRLAVARVTGQHLLEQREGAGRVLEVLVPERGQPRPEPVRVVVPPRRLGRGDLRGEDVGEEGGIGREEFRLPRELLRGAERPGVVRDRLERGAQRADRAVAVPEPVHANPAGPQPRVGGLLGSTRSGGGLVALLVEKLGHLAPRLPCSVGVAQPVARDLGHLPPEVPANAEVALQPGPAPQRLDQRRPGLAGAVDARQRGLGLDGGLLGQPLLHRAGEESRPAGPRSRPRRRAGKAPRVAPARRPDPRVRSRTGAPGPRRPR